VGSRGEYEEEKGHSCNITAATHSCPDSFNESTNLLTRLAVPAGCVGVFFESDAPDELPPDILYAVAQIVISTLVGDFGSTVIEVERGSRRLRAE